MTDLTLKENEQWLNGYKAGYAHAQETALAMPRKEWIGLTDEEVVNRANAEVFAEAFARGVAWAELKLKEKNT
jgi:hypothetical protein